MKLFVYDAFKMGHAESNYLNGSKFIGRATTTVDYSLYELGDAYLVEIPSQMGVMGEVYEVDEGRFLYLDGMRDSYLRREISVNLLDGELLKANAYVFWGNFSNATKSESGLY